VLDQIAIIRDYFSKLGLEPDLADLYVALHNHGPQGILQLSRHSGIERRRIYRLIDRLININLIELQVQHKRSLYHAAPIGNLQILLSQKEEELRGFQAQLRDIDNLMTRSSKPPLTRILNYHGIEGLKQMFWNQTKIKSDNMAILYENIQSVTGSEAFFRRWVERCNSLDVSFRGIIGDHFMETLQDWYKTHHHERLARWESRYISPDVFPITYSTITCGDVVMFYHWKDGEVFGVELYNAEIAAAQRRIFELLWEKSQPVDDLAGLPTGS
jgi:sugar-specific transcriptional regulator TrmB